MKRFSWQTTCVRIETYRDTVCPPLVVLDSNFDLRDFSVAFRGERRCYPLLANACVGLADKHAVLVIVSVRFSILGCCRSCKAS